MASSVVCLKNSTVKRRSIRMFYYWGGLLDVPKFEYALLDSPSATVGRPGAPVT